MRSCEGCKFWSERVADAIGCGPVRAYCLNERNTAKGYEARMVYRGCELHEVGDPIDAPWNRDPRDAD